MKTAAALFLVPFLLAAVLPCAAEVTESKVVYRSGDSEMIGYLYSDTSVQGKKPGVLVFSDWMGIGSFAKEQAKALATLGYRAFAADIYGEGKQAANSTEAGALAGKFKSDRPLLRARAEAALTALLEHAQVNPDKVAAIGFCFGGTAALELARDGANIAGVVSFHGGLETPSPAMARNIKGKILALHGADDPFVNKAEVAAFEDEMTKAGVDWQLVKYGHAVHGFTNPAAGNDNSKGVAYNRLAATRSFRAMEDFFKEIF
jgi:dienelactone hydrolase